MSGPRDEAEPQRDATPPEPGEAPEPAAEPTFGDVFAAAAKRSGIAQVAPGEKPTASALLSAIGGVRGLVESILPGFLFLIVYSITQEVVPSVVAPIAIALVFIAVRAIQRQPVLPAIAGAIGIAVSAAIALSTGRAEDNFVLGLFINAGTILVMVTSILVRYPLIGVVVWLLTGDDAWRTDPAKRRAALVATVLWAVLPALRLVVQLPLYLAENAQGLAGTKLVMGVPLYAILLWVTWLLIRSAWTASRSADDAGSA